MSVNHVYFEGEKQNKIGAQKSSVPKWQDSQDTREGESGLGQENREEKREKIF